jgi:hypothetical protein
MMTPTRSTAAHPSRPAWVGIAALAVFVAVAGCSEPEAVQEPDYGGVRVAQVPTFTDLPPPTETITPLPSETPTASYNTPTPDRFQAAGPPVRLEIPAIGVDATFEQVGLLPNGAMDTPKIPDNVAWFDQSAIPGQSGKTAVVAGHLDSPYGPAVFYKLRMLVPGDEMAVTYASGEKQVFVVEAKERYIHDAAPLDKIYGSTTRRMMNLITCDGAWDRGAANYEQRLVVYAQLRDGS